MNDYGKINDSKLSGEKRVAALKAWLEKNGRELVPLNVQTNNHIHTVYSFSPYTPAMAALKAREAGLAVAGSVDHDSVSAAEEMTEACGLLGIGVVTGFEVRVSFKHTRFADVKLNNPDSKGIAYMTVQGIPSSKRKLAALFLQPICKARKKRNIAMTASLNEIITEAGLKPLSYEKDIEPLSKSDEAGSVTERHILYALAHRFIDTYGTGEELLKNLKARFNLYIGGKTAERLADASNPHYGYDLLGALKSEFLPRIFIQPDSSECIPAETVTAFAQAIGAVPAYAYLGDITESPTGDKKAEKFEDDFLDDLFPVLKELGYLAVTYMPPRNTKQQLLRLRKLCEKYGFMEISGVDINSSRQDFSCPELLEKEFENLIDATWALAAHEKLASYKNEYGLFSAENPLAHETLAKRLAVYADLGKKLKPAGTLSAEQAALSLTQER